jgi:hypothetical protein
MIRLMVNDGQVMLKGRRRGVVEAVVGMIPSVGLVVVAPVVADVHHTAAAAVVVVADVVAAPTPINSRVP